MTKNKKSKKPAKPLTEKEQLIRGHEKRIAYYKNKLQGTKKFHREVEAGIQKQIRMTEMQLKAIKKV